jgi:hypothetical protein
MLRKWGAARLDRLQVGACRSQGCEFFVVCLHLPGFAPAGDQLSFWWAKKKVGKEKGPQIWPTRMDTRSAGHLRQRWRTGAPARWTTSPCAGSPADGNTSSAHWLLAVGCSVERAAASSRHTGASGPLGRASAAGCPNRKRLFLCLLSFWRDRKKVGRPPGRIPANASKPGVTSQDCSVNPFALSLSKGFDNLSANGSS